MQYCPCGTGKYYTDCCGPFIQDQKKPAMPEALMRSRYTAYTEANIDYIARTMKEPAKKRFNPKSAFEWATQVEWLGLDVKKTSTQGTQGFVEFIAHFKEKGETKTLHELSEFRLENSEWYYVDGKFPVSTASTSPVGRNDLCPCGSGRKYKKCCLGKK